MAPPVRSPSLALRAGPDALALIRERGLRREDIRVVPAASGGAKWLAIAGLDRFLFGSLLRNGSSETGSQPLHLVGSSIGSWRMACLAQHDPVAALARGHHAYIHLQRYSAKPTTDEVTQVLAAALDHLLGENGVDDILHSETTRLHVITAAGRGFIASQSRPLLTTGIALAAATNVVSRRSLSLHMHRYVFHNAGPQSPFAHWSDLATRQVALTRENLRDVLRASASIPLLMNGVTISDTGSRLHWDGGVLDYNLDLDFGVSDGLVLFPHFFPHVIPGWFDKGMPWRRARGHNFRRTLLIAPSQSFVASLPGGKIPDRRDFYDLTESERIRRWQLVCDSSARLGEELAELIATNRLADRIEPWF